MTNGHFISVYTADIFNSPATLNPFMFMHNWGSYYSGNTNNWFEVELSGHLPWNIELNSEVFLDQIQMGGEPDDTGKTAFGILANAKKVWSFDDSILKAYAEFAYTNDCCYLRGSDIGRGAKIVDYKYSDLIVQLSDIDNTYNLAPIGYIYGTDVKAFALGASLDKWNQTFFADGMYIISGPNGSYENENRNLSSPTDALVQKTIKLNVGVKGTLFDAVLYNIKVGFGIYENFRHKAESIPFVPQYEISLIVDPVKLLNSFRKTL